MAKKTPMDIKELVTWIAKTRERQIDESCPCSRKNFLESLRDDPDKEIISIHSNISNWKIMASGETDREIADFDENEDLKISQDVVYSLERTFAAEIDVLED